MAGRSVGNIEVTVDADTGRITAKLTKEGARAGKGFKKAAEQEMRDLQAVINLETGEAQQEAAILRQRIEAKLHGIPIDVDILAAQARIQELEEQADATRLVMDVSLNDRDIAQINTRLKEFEHRSIQFDADMAAVNANLAKLEAENHEASIQFDADLAAINVNLETFRKRQEADAINLRIETDLARLNANFQASIRKMEHTRIDLTFGANLASINANLRQLRTRAEADAINLRIDGDLARLNTNFQAAVRRMNHTSVDVRVGADVELATRHFNAWLAEQQRKGIDVNVDPDTVAATVEFEAWVARMQRNKIDVDVDVDTKKAEASGFTAGQGFGDSFHKGLSTRMQLIIGAIVALAEPVGVALEGSLSAATSVISSAFSALSGGAGAALPVMAALGASVTTLVVGFQGLGDGLGAISEEFAKSVEEGRAFDANVAEIQEKLAGLAPSARDFAEAFAEMFPLFHELRQIVQEQLFAGMGDSLRGLTDQMPVLAAGLGGIATSFNRFFRELAERAADVDLGAMFGNLQPIIDDLVDAGLSLFDTLEPFLAAAAPAAQMLSESLRLSADGLQGMVDAGAESGGLTKFLVEGVESLRDWMGLLKETGDALFTLFEAGKSSGDGFVTSLTNVVTKWDDWMESVEGQKALESFFATGKQVMSDLKPVLKGLQGFFDNLVTPDSIDRFGSFADSLGDILPVLGQLLNLVGRTDALNAFAEALDEIGEALQPIMPVLQDLADTLGDTLLDAVHDLEPVLDALADLIGDLAPVIGGLADDLEGPLDRAFSTIAETLEKLSPHLTDMVDAVGTALIEAVDAANPILEALGTALGIVADAVGFLADAFSGLTGPMQLVVIGLLGLFEMRGRISSFATGAKGIFDTLKTSIGNLSTSAGLTKIALGDIFTGLGKADMTKLSQGFKDLGPALVGTAKGLGAGAGVAIAGGLAIAFSAQMALEADNIASAITGVLGIVASTATAFATGGPIMAALTLATGAIVTLFQRSATEARKAKAEIAEYTSAFEAMADGASGAVVLAEVMSNLKDETQDTRDIFTTFKVDIGTWVKKMINGTSSVEDAVGGLASEFGTAGKDIEKALDNGTLSVDNLLTALGNGQLMIGDFDLRPFRDEINASDFSVKEIADSFGFLRDEGDELKEGQKLQAQVAALAGDAFKEEADGADDVTGALPPMTEEQKQAAAAAKELADQMQPVIDKMIAAREEANNQGWELVEAGIVGAIDPLDEASKAYDRLRDAASEAEVAVKSFDDMLAALTDPAKASTKAASDFEKALDDLRETALGGSEAVSMREDAQNKLNEALEEEKKEKPDTGKIQRLRDEAKWINAVADNMVVQARSMDLTEEAGRKAGDVGEALANSIDDQARAFIKNHHSIAESAVAMVGWRKTAVNVGKEAGFTEEEINNLLNAYGKTPESIVTTFTESIENMDEAQVKALQLDADLNGLPDSIDTLLTLDGLTEAQRQMLVYDADLDGIPDVVDTLVSIEDTQAKIDAQAVIDKQAEIDALVSTPAVQMELAQFNADVGYVGTVMGDLNTTPEVNLDQVAADIGFVGNLMTGLDTSTAEPTIDADPDQAAADIGFVSNLVTALNGAKAEPVISVPTADQAAADIGVVTNVVTDLDKKEASPGVSLFNNIVVSLQLIGLQAQLDTINETTVSPDITLEGFDDVMTDLGDLDDALTELPDGDSKVTVSGVQTGIDKVNELITQIDKLKNKTITITVNQTGTTPALPGDMAGGMINGPTVRRLGERGYREAVIPMQLPLNRVNPEVREMAAILRGGGGSTTRLQPVGPRTVVNQQFTLSSADPGAVAAQVMNRAVALATR